MPNSAYVAKRVINRAFWRKKDKPLLGWLDMELTERCNNNCIHCCINLSLGDLAAKKKELSAKEIKDILREAVSLGCTGVRFTGGEPLLRGDFGELYVFARKSGLAVVIFTNATLINQHLVELFSRIPPLEEIEVTVYGMNKKSYESVTGITGSFEAAWRGINLLLENKIPFVIKGALLPPNKEEIGEFEKWAAIIPWMNKPPRHAMFFDLHYRRDEAKNRRIRKLRLTPEEGLKILTRRKGEYKEERKDYCSKFMRPCGDKLFSCGSGVGVGCVDAYGYFQPCIKLRHPECVYNLRKGSLKDALTNFFPKIREIRAKNPDYLERCAKCFLKGLCEQCPGRSWLEYGTLDTPVKYFCEIAHAEARFLGLLNDSEKGWEVADWKKRVSKFVQ